jgi:hypothetical protein
MRSPNGPARGRSLFPDSVIITSSRVSSWRAVRLVQSECARLPVHRAVRSAKPDPLFVIQNLLLLLFVAFLPFQPMFSRTRCNRVTAPLAAAVFYGISATLTQAHEQSLLVQLDLLERAAERAAVARLITAIPDGGRLLAIEGPPGIGKTALMAEARALAQEAGLQVLGARGSELERSFSYGVVRQLFEPLVASLPVDERAELLEGAAALAAPLFDPSQVAAEAAVDSSLATLHGLYWLTANLAARRPLLLALDDLHCATCPRCVGWPTSSHGWRASTSWSWWDCDRRSRGRIPALSARSSPTRWRS